MTANVMVSELEKYKKQGMQDYLGKPFTTQELWEILLTYLTPVSSEPITDVVYEYDENFEQLKMMRLNFYKNNQNVHAEILEAAAAGDTKKAHRLAHTLKGNAGTLGKTGLRNAALEVEALLKDDADTVWETKMNILKEEITLVLEEYKLLMEESLTQEKPQLSAEQKLALFEKLIVMLENDNPECVDLLKDIRAVPGTETLVQQIENYNFKEAARLVTGLHASTLADLKNKMGEVS
jgi:HPt (histidine-containing phosphotransfer) domain-containing protein